MSSNPSRWPKRFVGVGAARLQHGERVDRLGDCLWRGDPLADAVVELFEALPRGRGWKMFEVAAAQGIAAVADAPAALREFFAAVDCAPPLWFEREHDRHGGDVLFRGGALSGLVLALGSLPYGYAAPAGNKPLVLSGRLKERAARRINETARFVNAVCLPGGMRPRAEGWRIALKVRLMHARVRRLILRSGQWRSDLWGHPINQHDMVATNQLFSTVLLEGLAKLGFLIEDDEAERYMMLWRYIGEVSGVEPELLPTTWRQGRRLSELILMTQERPDADSRDLVQALLRVGPGERGELEARQVPLVRGLCRGLIGDALADQLGLPDDLWKLGVPALRSVITRAERLRRRVAGRYPRAVRAGRRHWARTVELGLAGIPATFELPAALA